MPPNTRTYVLNHIMDTMPIKYVIMSRIFNFFMSGLSHKCEIISLLFKNVLISNSSYMLQNINMILNELNIKYCDLFIMDKSKLKSIISKKVGEPDWRSDSIKELLSLRENQTSCDLTRTEIESILDFVSTER